MVLINRAEKTWRCIVERVVSYTEWCSKRCGAIFLAAAIIGLSGCASSGFDLELYKKYNAKQLLAMGERETAKRDYDDAIRYFDALAALYPFSAEAKQGQLDLIFVNYQKGEYDLARAAADHFLQLYPADQDADYAHYLKGLSFLKRNHMLTKRFWHSGRQETLDSSGLVIAYHAFNDLVTNFPDSSYASDAVDRMRVIRSVLADHELYLAKFYWRRGAYVAAINRALPVVREFAALPQAKVALEIIEDSYHGLGLHEQAARTRQLIKYNYGNSASSLEGIEKYGSALRSERVGLVGKDAKK